MILNRGNATFLHENLTGSLHPQHFVSDEKSVVVTEDRLSARAEVNMALDKVAEKPE